LKGKTGQIERKTHGSVCDGPDDGIALADCDGITFVFCLQVVMAGKLEVGERPMAHCQQMHWPPEKEQVQLRLTIKLNSYSKKYIIIPPEFNKEFLMNTNTLLCKLFTTMGTLEETRTFATRERKILWWHH
jgi:hypothetical protein